ncbi:MAG: hypothetical protein ABW036_10490 [Flavitalea sp.]
MKKTTLFSIVIVASIISSCGDKAPEKEAAGTDTTANTQATPTEATPAPATDTTNKAGNFDFSALPLSDKPLGEFPYIKIPKGFQEQNKPVKRNFDKLFFEVNGTMVPFEGKVYKTNVTKATNDGEDFSFPLFDKNITEAITALGGLKIFEGAITREEYERYNKQAPYLGEDGSIGYADEPTKVFIIRRKEGDDVLIQYTGNNASAKLNILQKAALDSAAVK